MIWGCPTPVALLGGVTWLTAGAFVSAGVGVYSSVLARIPALFRPPVINTDPVGSSVAVWSTRAVASPGVAAVKLFVAGGETSALGRAPGGPFPPGHRNPPPGGRRRRMPG